MMQDDPAARHMIIVEDEPEFQAVLSDALSRVPGAWSSSNFSRGEDAIAYARVRRGRIDMALVDMGLPDVSGAAVIRELRRCCPDAPILVVSVIANEDKVLEALQAGATGYLLKDDDAIEISVGIRQALLGHMPISPVLARCLIRHMPFADTADDDPVSLSAREMALLRHIAAGKSYAEAAHAMDLKVSTIHSYSRNLFQKLGVRSKTQALAQARRRGIRL